MKLIFVVVSGAVSVLGLSRRESWWKGAEILMLRHSSLSRSATLSWPLTRCPVLDEGLPRTAQSMLRRKGRTPKEIARALGLKPADVVPVIRAIGAQAPRREVPVAGCWVTEHWADRLGVTGHDGWPGMSPSESAPGESGLVGVLVARDTGSTVAACGFLVDVFCLGVNDTNGPKTMDRRKLPDFVRVFFSAWSRRPPVPAPRSCGRRAATGTSTYLIQSPGPAY